MNQLHLKNFKHTTIFVKGAYIETEALFRFINYFNSGEHQKSIIADIEKAINTDNHKKTIMLLVKFADTVYLPTTNKFENNKLSDFSNEEEMRVYLNALLNPIKRSLSLNKYRLKLNIGKLPNIHVDILINDVYQSTFYKKNDLQRFVQNLIKEKGLISD